MKITDFLTRETVIPALAGGDNHVDGVAGQRDLTHDNRCGPHRRQRSAIVGADEADRHKPEAGRSTGHHQEIPLAMQVRCLAANGGGAWSFTTASLADGGHAFTTKAVDVAGNVSTASSALNVSVDTVAPGVPTITSFAPNNNVAGTSSNQITLTGTAMAGSTPEGITRGIETWRAANPAPRATLIQVADHIDHIRKVAGIDHIGLGGDFDGITQVVLGLEDVATYPDLIAELLRRGYSDEDIRKITGRNILRVLKRAEQVAGR